MNILGGIMNIFPILIAAGILLGCGGDDSSSSKEKSFFSYNVETQADLDNLVAQGGSSFTVGDLTISGTDIVHLVGPAGLREVFGSLIIEENPKIERISGFESLEHANVAIQNNPAVVVIEGFDVLNNEAPHIVGNPKLAEVIGFAGIVDTGDRMTISGEALSNMSGYRNIKSIDGDLFMWRTGLADLDDFANLSTIDGDLTIGFNENLKNLDGFVNVATVSGEISIRSNTSLPTNVAEAFVERLRAGGFGGEVTIVGNSGS